METARALGALIGLGVVLLGLAFVIFGQRVADNMKAIRTGHPRSKVVVQLIGLALMAVGAAMMSSVLLGT